MKQYNAIVMIVIIVFLSVPLLGQWDVSESTDEMTGKKSAYCSSPVTPPTNRMDFPYSDTQAWLGIGCDGASEWVYIGFTNSPNLLNTDTQDGYNDISTRIKWDDEIKNESFTQTWGAKFIHFENNEIAIQNIAKSNTLLVELDWHGSGTIYFKFKLAGSSAAIAKMRAKCNISPKTPKAKEITPLKPPTFKWDISIKKSVNK
jgi:hypothetical protein